MATGVVKKLVADRGFGFVAADDGKDYFFHRTGLEPPLEFEQLALGERLEFQLETDPKGLRAAHLRRAS
jgi:CspA family cold shock protein